MGSVDGVQLWRDPLFSPGDRFPLGPPPEFWSQSDERPSPVGIRPFSLRSLTTVDPDPAGEPVTYDYDPGRQVTMVRRADGSTVTLSKHTKPGPTPGATSGYTDGSPKNPPPEEMGPADYQSD